MTDDTLHLRRDLYAALPHVARRRRRHVRRLIAELATGRRPGDGGAAGVREPRRPLPPPPGQSTSAL